MTDGMSDDIIERVARAIAGRRMLLLKHPDGSRLPDDLWQQCIPEARAAIEAMREPTDHSEIQVSYDLAREDKELTTASIVRDFEFNRRQHKRSPKSEREYARGTVVRQAEPTLPRPVVGNPMTGDCVISAGSKGASGN